MGPAAARGDLDGLLPSKQLLRRPHSKLWSPANVKALCYGVMNIVSASGIVFANKAVFNLGFHFTYALTWIHTVFTLLGMVVFAKSGMFEVKHLPQQRLVQLAVSFVAYIVLCNLSLKLNTVGFYQVMKIAVAPTVLALDLLMFGKLPKPKVIASVVVVCLGIGVATVTDTKIIKNLTGVFVGVAATVMTALYQIWAGAKQKELRASSMQLLHAYTPQASVMLGALVLLCEPIGLRGPSSTDTLVGFVYTPTAVAAILVSAVLGLLVSLSTFLVIGATSSLTYNVVGHLKTVIILSGGCMLFGDEMPLKKFVGVCIAMGGIVWYTQLKLTQQESAPSSKGPEETALAPLLPTHGEGGHTNGHGPGDPLLHSGGGRLEMVTAQSAYTAAGAFATGLQSRTRAGQGGGTVTGSPDGAAAWAGDQGTGSGHDKGHDKGHTQ